MTEIREKMVRKVGGRDRGCQRGGESGEATDGRGRTEHAREQRGVAGRYDCRDPVMDSRKEGRRDRGCERRGCDSGGCDSGVRQSLHEAIFLLGSLRKETGSKP